MKSQEQNNIPKTPSALYHQLFVPSLGGPNPFLLQLNKYTKKFSRISKYFSSLNLIIGFLLTLSIALKIYYISEYLVHSCNKLVHFFSSTLFFCFIWLISSFLIVFALKGKSLIQVKIYLWLILFCFFGLIGCLLYYYLSVESCNLHIHIEISVKITCFEVIILIFLEGIGFYLLKLLKYIENAKIEYSQEGLNMLK